MSDTPINPHFKPHRYPPEEPKVTTGADLLDELMADATERHEAWKERQARAKAAGRDPEAGMDEPITWENLCKLEPSLSDLYETAAMIGTRPGVPFCANAIWYAFFKPVLCSLVGYDRAAEGAIGTREAYDLAYETVYNALPDCDHEYGMCWG